jgi:hypothetical protein
MNGQQILQPHQQRVIDELTELDERIGKLFGFTNSSIYNSLEESDRALLGIQLSVMQTYAQILHKRIQRFPPQRNDSGLAES